MKKTLTQREAASIDAIMLVYAEGAEAMPDSVGDGFTITTTEDGGLQLAIYWDDGTEKPPVRRTLLVQGGMLRFFDSLAEALQKSVKAARRRKVVQCMGELTKERSAAS